jgi:hypothetical protein
MTGRHADGGVALDTATGAFVRRRPRGGDAPRPRSFRAACRPLHPGQVRSANRTQALNAVGRGARP